MAVVISDFEVVAEPAPAKSSAPAAGEKSDAEPASVWTARDIEKIVRREAERAARVRAD
jgi:hypothetical protein